MDAKHSVRFSIICLAYSLSAGSLLPSVNNVGNAEDTKYGIDNSLNEVDSMSKQLRLYFSSNVSGNLFLSVGSRWTIGIRRVTRGGRGEGKVCPTPF